MDAGFLFRPSAIFPRKRGGLRAPLTVYIDFDAVIGKLFGRFEDNGLGHTKTLAMINQCEGAKLTS